LLELIAWPECAAGTHIDDSQINARPITAVFLVMIQPPRSFAILPRIGPVNEFSPNIHSGSGYY